MESIKSIFSFILITILISGCKSIPKSLKATPTIENPKKLFLTKIKCLNMAEKLIGIGTKNDEILLLVFHLTPNNETELIASTDFLIFEKEDSIGQVLDLNILLDSSWNPRKLSFLLIELDTERSKKEVIQLTQNLLTQQFDLDSLKEKLREDDLLGLKTLSTFQTSKIGKLEFSGMHLFDKYHYEISYEFK